LGFGVALRKADVKPAPPIAQYPPLNYGLPDARDAKI
jgi:hypothetical protein